VLAALPSSTDSSLLTLPRDSDGVPRTILPVFRATVEVQDYKHNIHIRTHTHTPNTNTRHTVYSGKFLQGPIFMEGQSSIQSQFLWTGTIMLIIHCTIVFISQV
jgi:hypothetical protein